MNRFWSILLKGLATVLPIFITIYFLYWLGITSEQQAWDVALVGRNLLDQATSFGFDYPGFGGLEVPAGSTTLGSLNRPRTISLQARFNF